MKKRFDVLPLLAVLCSMTIAGCHPAYKATATSTKVAKALCAEEWLLFPDQPHPMFEEIGGTIKVPPAGMVLPQKYIHYRISEDTLRALFAYMRSPGKKGGMILPLGRRCEPFELRSSGAMSGALQAKYPSLLSLQGTGINNKAADVRLDWNGTQMRGQVTYNGAVYFITPVPDNNNITYIVYNRDDSNEVKQPFEAKPAAPATTPKVYYER